MESLANVSVKNAKDYGINHIFVPKGSRFYSMKGLALIHSDFDEILLLDADNIPAKDPTFLFNSPAFTETGAIFWKDYWTTRYDNPIFKILNLRCTNENEQESGQLMIKKSRPGVEKALSLAFYMQTEEKYFPKLLHGDKDTFRFAWRFLNLHYHMVFF
jgi:alpha 1,2-mannosyltransferase